MFGAFSTGDRRFGHYAIRWGIGLLIVESWGDGKCENGCRIVISAVSEWNMEGDHAGRKEKELENDIFGVTICGLFA